jgi:hypothetical protein
MAGEREQAREVDVVERGEVPQDRHLRLRDRVGLDLRQVRVADPGPALDVAQAQPTGGARGAQHGAEGVVRARLGHEPTIAPAPDVEGVRPDRPLSC